MFWTDPFFWLSLGIWIPYTAFVVLYGARSPWYRSALGRSLLLSKTVIALLAMMTLLRMMFGPDYWLREVLLTLVFGGALIAGWSQLFLLIREQRRDRRCPEEVEEPR